MTKREAAIISAYTGVMIGEFSDIHKYMEEKLERPIQTMELLTDEFWDELKCKCASDFMNIKIEEDEN